MNPETDWIDQARRLLDALRAGETPFGDGPSGHTAEAAAAHRSSDCRWCPVCQLAAVVRGERPEVSAALADVLTATATALRTFAAAGQSPEPAPEGASPDDDGPAAEDAGDPPPAVQRIEIA